MEEDSIDFVPSSPVVEFPEPIISVDLNVDQGLLSVDEVRVPDVSFSNDETIDYELENVQLQVSDIANNLSESQPQNETIPATDSDNNLSESQPQNETTPATDSDSDNYYEIESDGSEEEENTVTIPIENYAGDIEHEDDFGDGWPWTNTDDEGPSSCPFQGRSYTNLDVTQCNKPEDFFNAFFDSNMWTTISQETNRYARQTIAKNRGGRDVIEATSVGNVKQFSRMNNWKDVNEGDIKVFMSHMIITGLVKRSNLEKFWSSNNLVHTPFFGKY